jgi:hypothetical protein
MRSPHCGYVRGFFEPWFPAAGVIIENGGSVVNHFQAFLSDVSQLLDYKYFYISTGTSLSVVCIGVVLFLVEVGGTSWVRP